MSTQTQPAARAPNAAAAQIAGKYLTFRLANEEFGIEIHKVNEIIGLLPVTKLPLTPPYVRGVVNLRNKVIPTIDLRAKFEMEAVADTEKSCIVVVEVDSSDHKISLGVVVDEVAEVISMGAHQVDVTPDFGGIFDMRYVLGVGLVNESVKILLDIDHVLTADEISHIRAQSAAVRPN